MPENPHFVWAKPGLSAQADLFDRAAAAFKGHFEIQRLVAVSEERILFLARDVMLKRLVTLRLHPAPDSPGRAWFEGESELLAALDHPTIRPVYSAGYVEDWAYRVSKWVDGESLRDAVARGPRPIPAVIDLARDMVSALEYAHAQGIIMRRILPETLILNNSTGRAMVTDLRYANRCLPLAAPDVPSSLPFLAPETRGERPGEPASDIYTTGALLYYAITGSEPDANPDAIRPACMLRATCPKAVERVIMRALKRDPAERFLTAAEMAHDLTSDLGDYDLSITTAPPLGAGTEDARSWEKRLRRALGDDYELLDELGAGGFGRVYRVRDLRLEREVALKILHPFLTADPAVVERFHREAQVAARLTHPNIVSIYDIGGRAGLLWYTMAYVPGKSLARMVQTQGPLPVERVVRLLQEGLGALQHAHHHGVVHRDLKPENMLFDRDGSLRIADFGLALAFKGPDRHGGASSRAGTPEFAAPEQLLGEPVDGRADLFSLTAVAFYALTGSPPFGGGSLESIVARQTVGDLPDLMTLRDDVPEELLEVLRTGAGRHPTDRFPSAEVYAQTLRRAVRGARSSGSVEVPPSPALDWIKDLFSRG